MSVIGRLDNQVNDVLIAPLERQGPKAEDSKRETPAPDQAVRADEGPVKERPAERAELPVWLL